VSGRETCFGKRKAKKPTAVKQSAAINSAKKHSGGENGKIR